MAQLALFDNPPLPAVEPPAKTRGTPPPPPEPGPVAPEELAIERAHWAAYRAGLAALDPGLRTGAVEYCELRAPGGGRSCSLGTLRLAALREWLAERGLGHLLPPPGVASGRVSGGVP